MISLLLLTACEMAQLGTVEANQQAAASTSTSIHSIDIASASAPTRLTIEAIGLDTSVEDLGYSAAISPAGRIFNNWDVTDYAAGWHINSSTPGQGGNVVLSGHNNIRGAVFKELDQLEIGDVASIWSDAGRYDYEISEVLIVPERDATDEQRRQNAAWIGEFDDERLTLVTCWPRNGNSHRIIAVGHLVDRAADAGPQPIAAR